MLSKSESGMVHAAWTRGAPHRRFYMFNLFLDHVRDILLHVCEKLPLTSE